MDRKVFPLKLLITLALCFVCEKDTPLLNRSPFSKSFKPGLFSRHGIRSPATLPACSLNRAHTRYLKFGGREEVTLPFGKTNELQRDPDALQKLIPDSRPQLKALTPEIEALNQSLSGALDRLVPSPESKPVVDGLKMRLNAVNLCIPPIEALPEIPGKSCRYRQICKNGSIAQFDTFSHSLVVCPSALVLPKPFLWSTVLHELAHSIDPCSVQTALLVFENQSSGERRWVPVGTRAESAELKTKDWHILLEQAPVPLARYPFQGALHCLGSKEGGAFRLRAKMKPGFRDKAIADSACVTKDWEGALVPSQLQEVFSDFLAAKALSDLPEPTRSPEPGRTDMIPELLDLGPIGPFLAVYDHYLEQSLMEEVDGPHPALRKRIQQIFLREPVIAERSGCSPVSEPCK